MATRTRPASGPAAALESCREATRDFLNNPLTEVVVAVYTCAYLLLVMIDMVIGSHRAE